MTPDDLKDFYLYELNRYYEFRNSLTFPVSLIVILVGVVSLYLRTYIAISKPSIIFTILLGLSIFFIIGSFFVLILAVSQRHFIQQMPQFRDILKHKNELEKYHDEKGHKSQISRSIYEDNLSIALAEVTDFNSAVNQKRYTYISKSIVLLATAAMAIGACSIPYFIALKDAPKVIHKIEIINIEKVKPSSNKTK